MAVIRKRVNGKFQAIVRRKGVPPISKVFKHKADAVAWANLTESEIDRGDFVDRSEADRLTLKEAFEKYKKEVTSKKKGKAQETTRINYWQRHTYAKYVIGKLKATHFGKWRDEELAAGKSGSTVAIHFSLVSHLFNHARKEWQIPVRNPIDDLWRPDRGKGRTRRLIGDEEQRLIETAKEIHPLFHYVILFAIETAMRRSEIALMRRSNLRGNVYHLADSKNDLARDVPLSAKARHILTELPARIDGRIWPFSARTISAYFKESADTAGIQNLVFHDLRHEATSRLATKFEAHQLAKIRGDKGLDMVMHYYHPTGDELARRLDHS